MSTTTGGEGLTADTKRNIYEVQVVVSGSDEIETEIVYRGDGFDFEGRGDLGLIRMEEGPLGGACG